MRYTLQTWKRYKLSNDLEFTHYPELDKGFVIIGALNKWVEDHPIYNGPNTDTLTEYRIVNNNETMTTNTPSKPFLIRLPNGSWAHPLNIHHIAIDENTTADVRIMGTEIYQQIPYSTRDEAQAYADELAAIINSYHQSA